MGGKLFLLPDGGEPVMTNSSGRGVTGTGSVDALRTLALLALFLASRTALASEPWDAGPFLTPPATLLAVAKSQPAPKSAVEVLIEQYDYHIEASGPRRRPPSSVYRILDAKAAKGWSKVSVSWTTGLGDETDAVARVISPTGGAHAWTPPPWPKGATGTSDETYSSDRSLSAPFLPSLTVWSSRRWSAIASSGSL